MLVEALLDDVQSFLHDDGDVWPREELLRWLNDAYRELLYASHAVVRPLQLDLPGRTSMACVEEWESTFAPGTYRRFTRSARNRPIAVTFLWEVEQIDGITPTNSYDVVTQLWEQAYSGDLDAHFRFTLPRQSDRPLKVYWDSKRLAHTSVRELDESYDRWWRDVGEPLATMPGVGPEKSLEVYLLQTDYVQSYDLIFDPNAPGLPRFFSSDASRTYAANSAVQAWAYAYTTNADPGILTGLGLRIADVVVELSTGSQGLFSWESDLDSTVDDESGSTAGTISTSTWELEYNGFSEINFGVGLARALSSADRQYMGVAYDSGQDLLGIARRFASGDEALTVWHSIIPDRALTEEDEPDLIPDQFHKYLKFYTLARALSRKGEGFRPDLSQHWFALYKLGEGLLAMLGTPSVLDRVYAREQVRDASIQAPPRVRMPASFPRAR